MRIHFSLSILLFCWTLPIFSQGGPQAQQIFPIPRAPVPIPENDEARRELEELFFVPDAALRITEGRILAQQSTGTRVKFQIQRQGGHLYYLFQNEEGSSYSVAGAGNYIIKRNLETGGFVQIKVFLRNHPGCFVRLFPEGSRTSMDVYLFGIAVDRGVLLPLELQSLLTEPFAKVMTLTKATVRWERLLYRGGVDVLNMDHINHIQRILPTLSDRDDGALDAERRFVYIETGLPQEGPGGLNCSGFAKWISDGFFFPLAGRYLEIETLKEKHLEYRGNRWSLRFEEERDPYFGLDWSRNLAVALWGALGYPTESPEDFDVRQVDYLDYREDVGFPVGELELLLFLEASSNPGHFYIGSLNREYGGQPVLRQHFHLVVLFPYFTPSGAFRVAVFDRTQESSLEGIPRRFPGAYIHLVRLPLGDSFVPPLPEKLSP